MDPQKQEDIYLNLLQLWKLEIKIGDILDPGDNNRILREVRDLSKILKQQIKNESNEIAREVHKKTLKNLHYMLKDYMDIRAEKLLKYAQNLTQVDQTSLFSYERKYFEQALSAYKGLSKSKKLYTFQIEQEEPGKECVDAASQPPVAHSPPNSAVPIQSDSEVSEDFISNQQGTTPTVSADILDENDISIDEILNSEEPLEPAKPIPDYSRSSSENQSRVTPPKQSSPVAQQRSSDTTDNSSLSPSKQSAGDQEPFEDIDCEKVLKNVQYSLIRLLTSYPSLVGEDFKVYGPFSSEDLALLPNKNAEILIQERNAEKIATN